MNVCADCDQELTQEEKDTYRFRCEICEDILYYRLKNWRQGKLDMQFDLMFDRREQSVH